MKSKILYKYFMALLIIINASHSREISFGDEQTVSDQTASTGSSVFSNMIYVDVDNDGDLDLVLSQYGTGDEISWLENDRGDFTDFTVHTISSSTSSVANIQSLDIDQDGDMDIIAADNVADELLWFENTGSGLTWTEHIIDSGTDIERAWDFDTADIDNDGDMDIALAAIGVTTLFWYENVSNASNWNRHDTGIVLGGGINAIAIGDIDLDGQVDIAYALNAGTPSIAVAINEGDGFSWTESVVESGTSVTLEGISFEDLTLDGDPELYTYESNGSLKQWSYDDFSHTWLNNEIIAAGVSGKVSFVDVDNDGDRDILAGSSINISWYENTDGLGGTWSQQNLLSNLADDINAVTAADLDQDGDNDIILAKNSDGFVYAYENLLFHSTTQFENATVIESSHTNANHVLVTKMNHDQYPDIITANQDSSGMEIILHMGDIDGNYGNSETILNELATFDSEISAMAYGDLDNDSDFDIIIAADGSNSIYSIENQMNSGPFMSNRSENVNTNFGSNWGTITLIASGAGQSNEIQVADINADGHLDIILIDVLNDSVKWLDNNNSWASTNISTTSLNTGNLKVADIDGNGTLDVITASNVTFTKWFSNDNGDGLTWTETNIGGDVGYQIDIADMDSDGDIDVVYSAAADQSVKWAENNGDGSGSWTSHDTTIMAGFVITELRVNDIDNDGDLDILVQDNGQDFSLIQSLDIGLESWSLSQITSGLDNASAFSIGDFDLDGDMDLVTKGQDSSEIMTLYNNGGQFSALSVGTLDQNSEDSETVSVFDMTVIHNGRSQDSDMQLTSLHLGFLGATPCNVEPLTNSQINPLIQSIGFYIDDGDGVYNQFVDSLVSQLNGPFILTDGQLIMPLPDQHTSLQIIPDTLTTSSKDYFVTLKLREAASAATCHTFTVFLLRDQNAFPLDIVGAQDSETGVELQMSYVDFTSSGIHTVIASTNNTPTTSGISDQTGEPGNLFSVDISVDFSDADGDMLIYTAGGLPPSLSLDNITGVINGTPTNLDTINSPHIVTVVARDPQGAVVSSEFELVIEEANSAPILELDIPNQMAQVDAFYMLNVAIYFSDSDGDKLTFSAGVLPDGLSINTQGLLSGTPSETALIGSPYNIIVMAQDPLGADVSSEFELVIEETNSAPVLELDIPNQMAQVDAFYMLNLAIYFSDPDGDELTFSAGVLPDGLSIDTQGLLSGTPSEAAFVGSPYDIIVKAQDSEGLQVSSNIFTMNVSEGAIFSNGFELQNN